MKNEIGNTANRVVATI
jgi:hypothetical protein